MRRTTLLALTAALTLLASASAIAGTRTYKGDFKTGGTLTFKAHVKNGTPTAVYGLHWKKLPIDCAEGTTTYTGNLKGRIAVARRHFSAQIQTDTGEADGKFAGHFLNDGKKAKGFFKTNGDFPPNESNPTGLSNCHTGIAKFTVK